MSSISFSDTSYAIHATALDTAEKADANEASGAVSAGISSDAANILPPANKDTGYALQQLSALFQSSESPVSATDQLQKLLQTFKGNAGSLDDEESATNSEADLKSALQAIVQLMQSAAIANSSDETPIAEVDPGSFMERLFDIFKKKYEQAQQEAALAENTELISVDSLRTLEA